MQMLGELANVGKSRVTIHLNSGLCPPDLVRDCIMKYGGDLSVDSAGILTVAPTGAQAQQALQRFTSDLLAAVRERE
jgi:hypothetical protein